MKKFAAFLLALMLVSSSVLLYTPGISEENKTSWSEAVVNPIYKDIITEEEIREYGESMLSGSRDSAKDLTTYTSPKAAGKAVREAMKAYEDTIELYYWTTETGTNAFHELIESAYTHNKSDPEAGDYLHHNMDGYYYATSIMEQFGDRYLMYIGVAPKYIMTKEQAAITSCEIHYILNTLNLSGKTKYEKLKAIYGWICSNVTYNYNYANEPIAFSTYAAAVLHSTVCNGYASLLYRMLLECGIDNRIMECQGDNHAFNTVRIGNYYYLCDSTWDAQQSNHFSKYFARGRYDFNGHHCVGDAYNDSNFSNNYPLSSYRYTEGDPIPAETDPPVPFDAVCTINADNFPDPVFRQAVSDIADENGDGILSRYEANKTRYMTIGGQGITSLKGIEMFRILEHLDCSDNELTSLDLSKNINLIELDCSGNDLTTLDFANNSYLEKVDCSDNKLTFIFGGYGSLYELTCSNNKLTKMELRNNFQLKTLICDYNALTELDLSANRQLQTLTCRYNSIYALDLSNNPVLSSVNESPQEISLTAEVDGYGYRVKLPAGISMQYLSGGSYDPSTGYLSLKKQIDEVYYSTSY